MTAAGGGTVRQPASSTSSATAAGQRDARAAPHD